LAIELDDALHILDARSGADLIQPLVWPGQIIDAIAFHPSRSEVAVARPRDYDAQTAYADITVVNAHTGRFLFPPVRHQPGTVQLLFSRDGSELLIVGRIGRTLSAWDALTGQQKRSVHNPLAPRTSFYLSVDGRQLFAEDRSAILDAGTLTTIAAPTAEQPSRVHLLRSDGAELIVRSPPGAEAELHLPAGYDTPEPVIKLGNFWASNIAVDGSLAVSGEQHLVDFDTRRPLWSPLRDSWGLHGSDPTMHIEPTGGGRWQIPHRGADTFRFRR
jgi:WD40 repeat protein